MKNFIILGMVVFGVFTIFSIAWLLCLNKWSWTIWSKIIPPAVIGLVAIFFTLYFSMKGESCHARFNHTLYFNKLDKKPLDAHCPKRYAYGGDQFDISLKSFINRKITEQKFDRIAFESDGKKIKEFYYDMAYLKLLSRFFWIYADSWDIYINSVREGDSFTTRVTRGNPEPLSISLKWSDLFDSNNGSYILFEEFSQELKIKEIKVPPGTKINFDKQKNAISIKNSFVDASISFRNWGGSVGLGDYKWLLGYDDKKENEFWSEHYEILCTANFEKLRADHPDAPKYRRWIKTMFEEVQDQFGDERRLARACDYRDLCGPSNKNK